MKLMVVSHACVTPVNQQLYGTVERIADWKISIVIPSNWRDEYGRDCAVEQSPGFHGQLIPIPVRRSGNIILHTYRTSLRKLIRRLDPDTVYVNHEPYAAATAQVYWGNAFSGRRRPIGFYSCQNILKKYPPPFRWTEAQVFRSSAFAFPISSAVDDVFRRKGYRGPSTVLPLAIDQSIYFPREDIETTRREIAPEIQPGEPLIGYVGRFVPEKGLVTLLNAVSQLPNRNWRLALIGAGPMETELRRQINKKQIADRVTFTGFVPHVQVPRLLSAIDVLTLPSETQSNWREQFGRVLLESMSCGTPVVGSDSGEIGTLISETGGGLIFRERDAQHLAMQLQKLLSDPELRKQLATAGRNAVTQRFTIERAAQDFVSSIESANAKKSRSSPDQHSMPASLLT